MPPKPTYEELQQRIKVLEANEAKRLADEQKYASLFNQCAEGIYLHDTDGNIIDANLSAVAQSGYSRNDLLGMTVFDLHPGIYDREDILRQWQEWPLDKPVTVETRHKRKDGAPFPAEITISVFLSGKKRLIIANVHDLTKRKKLEASLRKSAIIIDSTSDAVVTTDTEGSITFWNKGAEKIFGYSLQEAIGQSIRMLYKDADQVMVNSILTDLTDGKNIPDLEVTCRHKTGRDVHILLSLTTLKNGDGSIAELVGITKDISDRRHIEAQLLQSQKMEAIGRLAGGVAHDFNNMLGVILGHVDLAQRKLTPEQPVHSHLAEIREASERSASLTKQLLAFARMQTVHPRVIDLNKIISQMLSILQKLIGENVELLWRPLPELWPVKIDPSQVDQIMANLCINARDSISGTGQITIASENIKIDADACENNPGLVPGEYARITVSDNGCGMDEETLTQVFEPFFTTKGFGKGTGLGLSTVYGALKQNNGFIYAQSTPGHGTVFTAYLPRYMGKSDHRSAEEENGTGLRGSETILLVEDEHAILKMTTMMLEEQGYTVLPAGNPTQAIRIAEEYAGEIHLLMTDVVMPEMNGQELGNHLKTFYPGIKRLYMSGYTANVIAHHGILAPDVNFIQKPFSLKNISKTVRGVLGAG
jgi:PAS domain S-box-containing protein